MLYRPIDLMDNEPMRHDYIPIGKAFHPEDSCALAFRMLPLEYYYTSLFLIQAAVVCFSKHRWRRALPKDYSNCEMMLLRH